MTNSKHHRTKWFGAALRLWLIFSLLRWPQCAPGYSVLTHEQLIDLTWKDAIVPLLLTRFPQTTASALQEAHAYAYGGCAIQDLGYYPFGKQFFSNLTHYVRSGDFIASLFRNARTVNEYAFAIGALSHYVGDNVGHSEAINVAAAIEFPKLGKKYGPKITYDESPHAHVRTEFAFDIDELSKHRLAPGAYLRFVGLKVPRQLLEKALFETYALRLRGVLGPERPAIRSYRWSVRSFLPRIAYAETVIHRDDFPPDSSDDEFKIFAERIAQADFQNGWERYRRKPGIETRLIAFLIRIVPKIGALSDLAIKVPDQHTQGLYVQSLNRTLSLLEERLKKLTPGGERVPVIPDRDLDTGEKTQPGAYERTDKTYAELLQRITSDPPLKVPLGLQQDVLAYYADPAAPISTKKDEKAWKRVQKEVGILKQMPTLQ